MLVIPAIDILNNKVVRLEKGKYDKAKIYHDNPVELAVKYSELGFKRLHVVDLAGSKTGITSSAGIIKKISELCKIEIQFGGGVRTADDARYLFSNGVKRLVVGSLSIIDKKEFEKIINKFNSEKIIVAADVKNNRIRTRGWTEETQVTINDHIEYCSGLGIEEFLCTDINTDGMLSGPNLKMYEELNKHFPHTKVIASGGVSSIDDIEKLSNINQFGVVVGKAIYENKIDLKELAKYGG